MAGVAQARETGICWDELTTLVVNRFILEVASFAAVVVVGDPGRSGGFGGVMTAVVDSMPGDGGRGDYRGRGCVKRRSGAEG